MKGVILCSDIEGRLNPITYTIPKQLIPIANVPIVEHIIRSLVKSNITEIGIIASDNINQFKAYFKDGRDFNCNIKYINQSRSTGYINALLSSKDFVDNRDFVFMPGNIYFDFYLDTIIKEFEKKKHDVFLLTKDFNTEDISLVLEDIENMPQIYFFTPYVIRAASKIKSCECGLEEIVDLIHYMDERKYTIGVKSVDGEYIKIDRGRDALQCNSTILKSLGRENSLGREITLENSNILDGTSIGDRSIIKNSSIYNSIIMKDCILNDVEIYDSIIGEGSTIIGPGSITGILGDKSVLYINN